MYNGGGDSQISCTIQMLKEAVNKKYDYYHLLSGVDLLLKTPKEINGFFEKNNGKEWISFDNLANETKSLFLERIKYYYLFQNMIGRNNDLKSRSLRRLQEITIKLQKLCNMDRTGNMGCDYFYKGGCWFSITHGLASYILEQEHFIKKYCYKSVCADEIFVQTIAKNSPYAGNIIENSLRYIDWKRGNPYTFRVEDYDDLCKSNQLFARKFSSIVDKEIIELIYNKVMREK